MKFALVLWTLMTVLMTVFGTVAAVALWLSSPLRWDFMLINVLGSLTLGIALTCIWGLMIWVWRTW